MLLNSDVGDLGERLRHVEEMLRDVLRRLDQIENYLKSASTGSEIIRIAHSLFLAFSLPAQLAIDAASRVIEAVRILGGADPITRSIIEALSGCEELSISEITRRVKALRGTASRRIVRERLVQLEERGIVIALGSGVKKRYILTICRSSSER